MPFDCCQRGLGSQQTQVETGVAQLYFIIIIIIIIYIYILFQSRKLLCMSALVEIQAHVGGVGSESMITAVW
jgi:hypothetical protein